MRVAPKADAALIIAFETPLIASSASEKMVGEIAIPNAIATTKVDLSKLIISIADVANISFSGSDTPSNHSQTNPNINTN